MTAEILVPVSFGELLDKISILQIKSERISDEGGWPMCVGSCRRWSRPGWHTRPR